MWRAIRKTCVALAAVVWILGVSWYGWHALGPPTWGPRFMCSAPVIDFGDVVTDGAAHHCTFVLSNRGRKPLLIRGARPDCSSCLEVTVPQDAILPGDRGSVEVLFHPERLALGATERRIFLETNDPALPHVILLVEANLIRKSDQAQSHAAL